MILGAKPHSLSRTVCLIDGEQGGREGGEQEGWVAGGWMGGWQVLLAP